MAEIKIEKIRIGTGDLTVSPYSTISSGSAAPNNSDGTDGDLYIRVSNSNSDIYIKKSGVWSSFLQGNISGLVSPASVTYNSGSKTFTFQSAANTSGSIDGGPVTIRNNTASSNGITLSAPSPLASSYTITLPSSSPASKKIVTLDATGNLASGYDVDNSTLTIASNTIKVADSGIGQTQLADGSVTPQKLSSTTLSQDIGNLTNSYTYNVPNDAGNHLINATTNLYTKTFTGVSGRPVLFNMVKDTSNHTVMELYWNLTNTPLAGYQIFGGFGFPGPQIQGYISVKFNGVEVSRSAYRAFANGNYTSGSYNTAGDPFSLILVPNTNGSQTLTIDVVSYGMIYGNGTLTWTGYINYANLQLITF